MDVSAETLQAFLDDAWENSKANAGNPVVKLTGSAGTLGDPLATYTATASHGLDTGDTVIISGASLSFFNGTFAVTVTGLTTFTYVIPAQNAAMASNNVTAICAPPPVPVLRAQLRSYETAAEALFRGGSIATVSKNSASQAYRGPGLGSYTPVQIANAWRMLLSLFDETFACINHELALHPALSVAGTVSTSGRTVAIFSSGQSGWKAGQIVTIRFANDTFFNLAGTPIVTVPSSTSFSYTITPGLSADDSAVAYYNADPCLPPDNSDGSVYNLMKRRLVVVTSVGTDMSDLRLPQIRERGAMAW